MQNEYIRSGTSTTRPRMIRLLYMFARWASKHDEVWNIVHNDEWTDSEEIRREVTRLADELDKFN